MMKKTSCLLILLTLILSCAPVSQREPRVYKPEKKEKQPEPTPPSKQQATDSTNVFDAPFDRVWIATLEGMKWLKWPPAFINEQQGTITLKEAFSYRKNGKLVRSYTWPTSQEVAQSDIQDYLQKIALSNPDIGKIAYTHENMRLRVFMLPDSRSKVEIDYNIRPYTVSGNIGFQAKSSGYIESLLLEQIKKNLGITPVSRK